MEIQVYRLLIVGLGNVGRSLLAHLHTQAPLLREQFGAEFRIVGAADSGGSAVDPDGLDLGAILAAKSAKRSVAMLPNVGRPDLDGPALVQQIEADVLLESTPVNMQTGQPGLDCVHAALGRSMHVVIANKGPVALAYSELAKWSDLAGDKSAPRLRFSACVGGFMPTINVGMRDLRATRIERVEGVLNGTTQIILRAMESGGSYADALRDAQERGLAETDPSLDVEGWDAANKLVILANSVLRQPAVLDDVDVLGISRLQRDDLQSALAYGKRIVLLCLAERDGDRYRLSVRPTALDSAHPLARMSPDEMGVVYYTDISGRLSFTTEERGPGPTAAAMLRDLIDVVS